jgi:malate dehydrogenase (oxaloacetate-decarboxylating)
VWEQHRGGKIGIHTTAVVRTLQDIREVYTPGVARVVSAIAEDESIADEYTWRGRTVAIVTNGTRVLGLGDVGPAAALPVMEGKALFYADLVGLNAVPIVLDTKDPHEVIETVVRLAPGFGGFHLEDIATPEVYEIERELKKRLNIPVFYDDQHRTAVVVIAAVISAERRVGRPLSELTFARLGLAPRAVRSPGLHPESASGRSGLTTPARSVSTGSRKWHSPASRSTLAQQRSTSTGWSQGRTSWCSRRARLAFSSRSS